MNQFHIKNVDPEMLDVVKEFPKIFLEPSEEVLGWYEKFYKNKFPKSELCNLRYGFEHGNGWKEIVRGFCREIQDLCDKASANGDRFQYKGCIMKEKFGEFTPQGDYEYDKLSWEKYRDAYYTICNKWEEKSLTVCEITGKEGRRRRRGSWLKTLCDEEAEKLEYGQEN